MQATIQAGTDGKTCFLNNVNQTKGKEKKFSHMSTVNDFCAWSVKQLLKGSPL